MKYIRFFSCIGFLVWMVISSLHLMNPYLRSSEFIEISVTHGDSVWMIARQYASKEGMAQELEEAIIEVNRLPPDGAVHAGRSLLIPTLTPANERRGRAVDKALDTPALASYNDFTD